MDSESLYRNEWKHEISYSDVLALRQRLRVVMNPDPNAGANGCYEITSLYFDTPEDKALREKIDGVGCREKFRLRYYNDDTSLIRLEKKVKKNGYGKKLSAYVTSDEAKKIISGELDWMATCGRELIIELYAKMKAQRLQPKTIVNYIREAFVYSPGNVRVTIDYNIRTGLFDVDFIDPDYVSIPAGEPVYLLEVKWDEFLPSTIRKAVQLQGRRATAFSKYRMSRIYG